MPKKLILGLILFLSIAANIGAVFVVKHLYLSTNLVRLNPLQLDVYQQAAPNKSDDKKRVVFFGDSRALSWPSPNKSGFEFINRGIGHQTSAQIHLRYSEHVAPLQADIIVLQLCVNDLKVIPLQTNLRERIVKQCKSNLQKIINRARQQGTKIILGTVFPLGAVPLERKLFWSDDVTQTIHEVNQFISSQETDDIIIFDSFSLLKGAGDEIKPNYSRDLLHLNQSGYDLLNEKLEALLDAMK